MKHQTQLFYQEHPFLLEKFSQGVITHSDNYTKKALFFGTGLATRKEPSLGLPFDFLSYMLTAEALRRHHGLKKIIQVIGDKHALTNPFMDKNYVNTLASHIKKQITTAIVKLDLKETYDVILISEICNTPQFKAIHAEVGQHISQVKIPNDALGYVQGQLTDMEYFVRYHHAGMKMSWILDPKRAAGSKGYDECIFDHTYQSVLGENKLAFAYTVSGFTSNPNRFRVSPYIYVAGEERIFMSPDFNVLEFMTALNSKMNAKDRAIRKAATNTYNHILQILAQYERLFGTLLGEKTESKIQRIIALFGKDHAKH